VQEVDQDRVVPIPGIERSVEQWTVWGGRHVRTDES
jgi:hypothetical protein